MKHDVYGRSHSQHPGGESAGGFRSASVAAKAAAIDAAQARSLTRKGVVKQVLVVAVGGSAIYLVLPKLIAVLGSWPRLATLNAGWFTVTLAAELVSFTCNFAPQRLALRTGSWFAVVTTGLAGNAVTDSLPGGDAAGAAVQFSMLSTAGFDTDTAIGGLTAFSLLGVGGLLALPVFALPAILAGAPASRGLVHTALFGLAGFALFAVCGSILLCVDWPLATLGRAAQRVRNRVTAGRRPPLTGLDTRLLVERDTIRGVLGRHWRQAVLLTAGRLGFDYGCLLAALRATGADPQPSLVLLAYSAAGIVALLPLTPGGLGIVEASLSGLLILAGVDASYGLLATLAYRVASYWLPLFAGPPAYLLFRHRFGRPVPRSATHHARPTEVLLTRSLRYGTRSSGRRALQLPDADFRDDVQLATAANNALAWDATVPEGIEATAHNGNLTLTGFVTYGSQRLAAERAVSSLIGVRNVKDDIEISYGADPVDVTILVDEAIDRNALFYDDSDVQVTVTGNTVTLRGHVRTWAEHDTAVSAAWMASGVYTVIDDIIITG